jgi:hypothetical protein
MRDERYTLEPDATVEETGLIFLPIEIEAANSPVSTLAPVPSGRIEEVNLFFHQWR